MNNKKKEIIKYLIILLVLVFIILIIILYTEKKDNNIGYIERGDINQSVEWSPVKDDWLFFTAKKCIDEYFLTYSNNDSKKLINILDKNYIQENNITESNVLENCKKNINIDDDFVFIAKNMYYNLEDELFVIYVQGYLIEEYTYVEEGIISVKQEYSLIVKLDFSNMAYSINPNYSDKLEKVKNEVEANEDNFFEKILVDTKTVIDFYISRFWEENISDIKAGYNILEKSYREKKFGNIEEYEKYFNNMTYSEIDTYSVIYNDDFTQYICLDLDGNYYIINVTACMQYSVMLDFYTIDIEKVKSEYDKGNEQQKVIINIQKVIEALNDKDYKYIYNKLYSDYKNNNYKTLEEFQNYMLDKFPNNVEISYNDFSKEGDIYIYNITLRENRLASKDINMQIIMKLNEGTDFEMSFNIN